MTAHPDVLRPDEQVDAAWASLTSHHYRHLPVVDGDQLVGVVSLRDLMGVARIRPAAETQRRRPGRARGRGGGRDHGRRRARPGGLLPLPAVLGGRTGRAALARGRLAPALPGRAARRRRRRPPSPTRSRRRRSLPPGLAALLPALARRGAPLDVLRSAVSVLGAELGWRPTHDIGADELDDQALGLCAVVPTILAAAHRLREGPSRSSPRRRPRLRRQLPLHADRGRARARRTPGPSSST